MPKALIMIPIRMSAETIAEIDAVVDVLGGTKSEFIRRAAEERLAKMKVAMDEVRRFADDTTPDASVSEYHEVEDLSPAHESEAPHA